MAAEEPSHEDDVIGQIVQGFKNGSGTEHDPVISRTEFARVLQVLDPVTFDSASVQLLLARYDHDGSNVLDVHEFVEWLSKGVVSQRPLHSKPSAFETSGMSPLSQSTDVCINLEGYTCLRKDLHVTIRAAPKDGQICETLSKVLVSAGLSSSYAQGMEADLDDVTIWFVSTKMDKQSLALLQGTKEKSGQFRRGQSILIYPSGMKHGAFIAGLVAEGIQGPTVEIGMNYNNLARAKPDDIDLIEMQWMSRVWTKLMRLQGVRTYDNEKSLAQAVYDFVMDPHLASPSRGCTSPDGTPLLVGFVGSTSFQNQWTCKLLRQVASELMMLNKTEGHREIVIITGGFRNMTDRNNADDQGVGHTVAQQYYNLGGHAVHILPEVSNEKDWSNVADHMQDGTFLPCDHGLTLYAGMTNDEHLTLMAGICDILFLLEGGPGAATQAKSAYSKGLAVVPVRRSGGAASGLFGMPYIERPIHIDRTAWEQIAANNVKESNAPIEDEDIDMIAKAMMRIVRSAIYPLDAIEELHQPNDDTPPTPPWIMVAAEELKREIYVAHGARICILGSTQYYNGESEKLVGALAREFTKSIPFGRAVFITGGLPGVQETFAKNFGDESRLFHLLPSNTPSSSSFGIGQDLYAGSDANEKRQVFGNLGDIYITIEGGPGVAEEARNAFARGAYVLPMIRTGGASAGKMNFPAAALRRPRCAGIDASLWDFVEKKVATPEEIAHAVGKILNALIESIYPSRPELRRSISNGDAMTRRLSAPKIPLEWQYLTTATEVLKTKMMKGTRICILGSTVFERAESEELVKTLASALSTAMNDKSVVFVTGGFPGVQQTFAENCGDGTRLFNLVPHRCESSGGSKGFTIGVNAVAGADAAQRKQVFDAVGDIYIVIEGDYDVAAEAKHAYARGATIVPFSRTGGASNGACGFPREALNPPAYLSKELWSMLGRSDVPVEDSANAGVSIISSIITAKEQRGALTRSVSVPPWQLRTDKFSSPLDIVREGTLKSFFDLVQLSEKGFRTYGRWSHAEASTLVQTLRCLTEFFQEFVARSHNSNHISLMKQAYIESGSKFRRVYSTIVKDVIQGEEAYEKFIQEVRNGKKAIPKSTAKGQPTCGIGYGLVLQVYREAYNSMPRLNEFCKKIADQSGTQFLQAPLKRMFRSMEKIVLKYGAANGELHRAADGLKDVARAALQGNMEQLLAAFKLIVADENVEIVRIKNRFDEHTDMGWADCQLMLVLLDTDITHVCEVQLVHKQLMIVRSNMGAHHEYARVRAASEMLDFFKEDIPALDPGKKLRSACKVRPSFVMSFPPQFAQSRQPAWQTMHECWKSVDSSEHHQKRFKDVFGDDATSAMAIAFGIADDSATPFDGKVSLRWESEEFIVFDYHDYQNSFTPLHLVGMPTAWRIEDWSSLCRCPALGLKVLEKMKSAFAEALVPFLNHEQWRSSVMRDPKGGWPAKCDAAYALQFLKENAVLGVENPAKENQLTVHCLVLPFYPWTFERFVNYIRPSLHLGDGGGKFIYLDNIEKELQQRCGEAGNNLLPGSSVRAESALERSQEDVEKLKNQLIELQKKLGRWGNCFMGFHNEGKGVVYEFDDTGCVLKSSESVAELLKTDTWRLTSYGKPCEGETPQGTYYGFPKKLEDVSLEFMQQ